MKFTDVIITDVSANTRVSYESDIKRLQKLMEYDCPTTDFCVDSFLADGEHLRMVSRMEDRKYSNATRKNMLRALCRYLRACGKDVSCYRTLMTSIDVTPVRDQEVLLKQLDVVSKFPKYAPSVQFACLVLLTLDPQLLSLKLPTVISVSKDSTQENYIDPSGVWFINDHCYNLPAGFYELVKDHLQSSFLVASDGTPVAITDAIKAFNQVFKRAVGCSYDTAAQTICGTTNPL